METNLYITLAKKYKNLLIGAALATVLVAVPVNMWMSDTFESIGWLLSGVFTTVWARFIGKQTAQIILKAEGVEVE